MMPDLCEECGPLWLGWSRDYPKMPIRGWIVLNNPRLSMMNLKAARAQRSQLVSQQMFMIEQTCQKNHADRPRAEW
jgi:hypothetical protein